MASTRKASIGAEIRADRSKFKSDLDAAKADARGFRERVVNEFGAVEKSLNMRGTLQQAAQEFQRIEQAVSRVKSAAASASVFMSGFQKETTRARLEIEQRTEAAAAMGFRPMAMQIKNLKLKDEVAANAPGTWMDPAFVSRTRAEIQGLTRDTLTANTAMMEGGKGATNAGMGMLFLSQTLDDAQYGFKGIVNNIAPLVMGFGGSERLAGALTIVAVLVNQLSKAWDDFSGSASNALDVTMQMTGYQREQARALYDLRTAAEDANRAEVQRITTEEAAKKQRDRRIADEERLAQLRKENDMARLRNGGAPLSGQMALGNQAEDKAAQDSLAARSAALEKDKADARRELQQMGNDESELRDLQREQAKRRSEIKAFEDRLEATKDKPRGEQITERAIVMPQLRRLLEQERRQAELEGKVPGQVARRTQLENFLSNEAPEQAAQLENERDVAAEEKKRRELELENQKGKEAEETVKKGFSVVVRLFGDMRERAADSIKKNREAWEREQEKARAEQTRADRVKQLEIDTLRASGKGKQADALQADFEQEQNVRQLESEGFSPEDAARMAGQMRQNAEGPRRRGGRIKGAISKNRSDQPFDFDAFQNERIGYDFNQQKTPANNAYGKTNQALREARDRGDKGAVEELKSLKEVLGQKLDALLSATGKTAGEKTKPKNAT